ncbi:rRNA pseudouridine synthase [Methanococcoides sp. SA1]|nr:rRNA pseudouridine synthase [Methanococcoides sp. SA1]
MERLQKIIANSGYTSRRKAETLIEQNKVTLNGAPAKLGDKATSQDKIEIEGKLISQQTKKEYYILNKPKGILVTKHDPRGRKTIYNLPSLKNLRHLNYVGRLDAISEGLLILTNDGDLQQQLTHPKHKITKTYHLRTDPIITKAHIADLKQGIPIESKKFFAEITNKNNNEFDISIQEGRNRIIRKAMQKLGYKIFQLKRIQVGPIKLGNLKPGRIKEIPEEKIKNLT